MDTDAIRALLDKRDALDAEIQALILGNKERKPQTCSKCGLAGHSARTCEKKTE